MDDNLLNEFLIFNYNGNLVIRPTDNAYELLGLNEKVEKYDNGAVIDLIDDYYYRVAFLTFLKNNYTISAIVRESKGNSHDASWKKEVTIFNNGGVWQEELDKYKSEESSTYSVKPEIINEEEISKEIIEGWSKKYDLSGNGESQRLIYCSYSDGSGKRIYSVSRGISLGSPIGKNKSADIPTLSVFLKLEK